MRKLNELKLKPYVMLRFITLRLAIYATLQVPAAALEMWGDSEELDDRDLTLVENQHLTADHDDDDNESTSNGEFAGVNVDEEVRNLKRRRVYA